jgi:hypothetical protein
VATSITGLVARADAGDGAARAERFSLLYGELHGLAERHLRRSGRDRLAALSPALAELVDLKFFCGFTFAEIAGIRAVSERTVQRNWSKARVLLHRFLDETNGASSLRP